MGVLPPNPMSAAEHMRLEEEDDAERAAQQHMQEKFGARGQLHENLRLFRERNKLSKQEMAELLEVSARTYYAYENGQRVPGADAIAQLIMLTGGDANELLLGRPLPRTAKSTAAIVDEAIVVLRFLAMKYPEMHVNDRYKVARMWALADLDGVPRMHPDVIRDFVKIVTRYRFHPEDIPAPPDHEDYGDDHEAYERDMAEWQRMVEEDSSPPSED
jgi:transcriptional regulator with XRE-family HTH domain